MGWYDYFFGSNEIRNKWVSILIIFADEGSLVLDKGYILLGDIPLDYLGYYCHFTNFNVIEDKLYYFYKSGTVKQIDPSKVHLHIKIGQVPFEISKENLNYWNLFFSSTKNQIYNSIKNYLTEDRIKMINLFHSSKRKLKISNIKHPLFTKKQVYGKEMDQAVLSGLDISLI